MASHRSSVGRFFQASLCSLLLGSGCQSTDTLLNWKSREDRELARTRQELLDKVNAAAPRQALVPVIAGTAADHVRYGQNEVAAWYSDRQNKHLTEARTHFNESLHQSPREVKALHGLAIVSDLEGRFEEAEKHYLAALVQVPTDSDILGDLGYSYLLQGRLAESEQYCQRAIQANNNNRNAVKHLADSYSRQGKTELARATYQRVLPAGDIDRALAENVPSRSSNLADNVQTSLLDRIIPGPSAGERFAQDLQSRMAEVDRQKPVVPPSLQEAARLNGQAGARPVASGPDLQRQLTAIDLEQYHNVGQGAIMIDGQSGQAQRIPGSGFAGGAVSANFAPMVVEANAQMPPPASAPLAQPPQYAPDGGVPAEYHQAQPLNQYLQAQRGPQGSMGFLGQEPPQRVQGAAMQPGYSPQAGQANPAGYGVAGPMNPNMQVQPALLQSPAAADSRQPQPYRGASPYYDQNPQPGPAPYAPAGRGLLAQNPDPRLGPLPAPGGFQGNVSNGAPGPGLNAALNAAGQPAGPGGQPLVNPNGAGGQDAFLDASRAASRVGMGLQPGQNGAQLGAVPPSQYPGQGTIGADGQPLPQAERRLPTQLPPPDLSRAYQPNQLAIQPPAVTQGGQLPNTSPQLYSQDQYGTQSRYDERTMLNSGVPQPLFSDPRMQQFEAQRWQAGQQFNHAVENIWNQGQVNSPANPMAGSVYTQPNQMGQAPGYTPNVPQPYQGQFPAQWPGAVPNQFNNAPLSHNPQSGVPPTVQINGPQGQYPAGGGQYPAGSGQYPAQYGAGNNGNPQVGPNIIPGGGAQRFDSNVVVPQPYQPGQGNVPNGYPPAVNPGPGGSVNYYASPNMGNGVNYQPGLPTIRPAPR